MSNESKGDTSLVRTGSGVRDSSAAPFTDTSSPSTSEICPDSSESRPMRSGKSGGKNESAPKKFTFDEVEYYRAELRKRDGDNCYLCNRFIEPKGIRGSLPTIDHVYPKSLGGPDDMWNLRLTHQSCNAIKGNCIDAGEIEQKIKNSLAAP